MVHHTLFSLVIYFIILLVVFCAIKVYVYNVKFHTIGEKKYGMLVTELNDKKDKSQIIKDRISLANSFEKNLPYRFFVIHKELLELQKLFLKL